MVWWPEMTDANFDSVLKILQIAAIFGATGIFVFKLGNATTRFELIGTQQGNEIAELKAAVKELSAIVVSQALQTQRIEMIEKRVEEMRHGRGFVANGEYPRS